MKVSMNLFILADDEDESGPSKSVASFSRECDLRTLGHTLGRIFADSINAVRGDCGASSATEAAAVALSEIWGDANESAEFIQFSLDSVRRAVSRATKIGEYKECDSEP